MTASGGPDELQRGDLVHWSDRVQSAAHNVQRDETIPPSPETLRENGRPPGCFSVVHCVRPALVSTQPTTGTATAKWAPDSSTFIFMSATTITMIMRTPAVITPRRRTLTTATSPTHVNRTSHRSSR